MKLSETKPLGNHPFVIRAIRKMKNNSNNNDSENHNSSSSRKATLKDFYTSASCPKLPLLMLDKLEMYDDDDDDYKLVSVKIYDEHSQRKDPEEERKYMSDFLSAGRKRRSNYLREHPVTDEREFLSLSKGKMCKFSFPEVKGMECRGSKGWLTMVERSTVLSARPSETSDYVVMVVFMEEIFTSPGCGKLRTYTGFWKPGNLTWTELDIPCWVEDLTYYNGMFYALTMQIEVWMCDVSGPDPKASKIVKVPGKPYRPRAQLVECGGRLLIVAPYYQRHHDMSYEDDLEMFEIDVIKGSYNIITNLGSSSVFLGRAEGFSVDANEFPGILQPNSIYFGNGKHQVATPGPYHTENFGFGVWLNF